MQQSPTVSVPGLVRRVLTAMGRLALRIFFRRIEIVGATGVPRRGPVIFVLNHPNGLVDPLLVLALAPRRVSFLAKAPLFDAPVVGYFVRAFECLPVYRAQDGADPARNRATLEAARDLLVRGGSIALFPEGRTHGAPALQPLKTGAARIALGAQSLLATGAGPRVRIVPAGLYYSARGTFRSGAVLVFGPPVEVDDVSLDAAGEPPPAAVRALTARLDGALRALTVNADDAELVDLAATAARLLRRRAAAGGHAGPVHHRLELMQRILERHALLVAHAPAEVDVLVSRLRRYRRMEGLSGLGGDAPDEIRPGPALRYLAATALTLALAFPLVVLGVVENWVPYRLVASLGRRFAGDGEEVLSTGKMLGGLVLFPAAWVAVSAGVGLAAGWGWAVLHLLVAPLGAAAALWLLDRAETIGAGARVLWLRWTRPGAYARLRAEREALAQELLAAGG